MKKETPELNIVSVGLSPEAKRQFDALCDDRGMTIKILLGRLISWFATLDLSEQAIVLGQIESANVTGPAELIRRRERK